MISWGLCGNSLSKYTELRAKQNAESRATLNYRLIKIHKDEKY